MVIDFYVREVYYRPGWNEGKGEKVRLPVRFTRNGVISPEYRRHSRGSRRRGRRRVSLQRMGEKRKRRLRRRPTSRWCC